MFPSPASPYNSMSDQIKDAFMMSGTLAGKPENPIGGNAAPRYNFAAGGVPPRSIGGYGWNFNFPGGGNGSPGGGGPTPPGGGYTPPPGVGGVRNPGTGPLPPGLPPDPSLTRPPRTTPGPTAPGSESGGGLLAPPAPAGVMFPNWEQNWQTPQNPTANQEYQARLGGANSAGLLSAAGGNQTQANQLANYYNVGGQGYDPQKSSDAYMQEYGDSEVAALTPGIRSMYEDMGVIVNGKFVKKMDNDGNWIPI